MQRGRYASHNFIEKKNETEIPTKRSQIVNDNNIKKIPT